MISINYKILYVKPLKPQFNVNSKPWEVQGLTGLLFLFPSFSYLLSQDLSLRPDLIPQRFRLHDQDTGAPTHDPELDLNPAGHSVIWPFLHRLVSKSLIFFPFSGPFPRWSGVRPGRYDLWATFADVQALGAPGRLISRYGRSCYRFWIDTCKCFLVFPFDNSKMFI